MDSSGRRRVAGWAVLAGACLLSSCAATRPPVTPGATLDPADPPAHGRYAHTGWASYYARAHDGLRTASGEPYDMDELTAAHRTLPFGTRVRVTNLENGRRVVVRINDRGPFRKGRILDVSYAAARRLGMLGAGVARVRIRVLGGEGMAKGDDD